MPANRFTAEVSKQLRHYVYRMIDPRNGQTFYVGNGEGNRIFAHIHEELKAGSEDKENSLPLKLEIIRAVRRASLEVLHVIHRHGMDKDTAVAVEAALIDAIPGLANIQSGHGSNDHGPSNVIQLAKRYGDAEIDFDPNHRLLIIKIRPETVDERGGVYEAVRWAWRLNKERAESIDYVLAIEEGVCEGVFVADRRIEIAAPDGRRLKFEGRPAPSDVRGRYRGKRIPASMRKKGMASPSLYWPSR